MSTPCLRRLPVRARRGRPALLRGLRGLVLAGVLACALPGTAGTPAEVADALDGDEPRLVARLLTDPLGDGVWRVGVELVPDPGWHVYWRNPGETGLAPRFDWNLAGGRVGPVAWPVPRSFYDADADLRSYGYDAPVLLAARARLAPRIRPDDAAPGGGEHAETPVLGVEVDALVCAHQCIPGSFSLRAPLVTRDARDPAVRARFDAEATRLPRPADAVAARVEDARTGPGGRWRATLVVAPCGAPPASDAVCGVGSASGGGPAFFPYAGSGVEWTASPPRPHAGGAPDVFAIDLEGRVARTDGDGPPRRVAGVVPLRDTAGRERSVEVDLPLRETAGGAGGGLWLRAVLLGLAGGLLLNLMPCVLPVLAIKLHSLTALARGSRSEHRRHAAAYVAGIELSMLALAAAVLGLRAAGTAVGWGFQLQEPVFVVAISALLVAFALNLFGVFEIQVDTSGLSRLGPGAPGATRSFFDGLLAVALATPCSAPFLGTAVGFAFASPGPVIVSIFLAIGAGLASPFVGAALFPGWMRGLPRSGAWMADLRGLLGFALLATVIWLLWILGRAAGSDAVAGALIALLAVAGATWGVGLVQRRGRALPATALAALLVGVAAAGIGVVDLSPRPVVRAPAVAGARPFAAEAVRTSVREGRPAFVYFTADWCVTCKVNEKGVLADPRVVSELERLGFAVFRGDWTRRDESIRRALAGLGKAGVPVYALYAPGAHDEPTLLPELLTVDGVLEALRETAGPVRAGS